MQVLATIAPLDPASGSRVTLRCSSADAREMLALNSVRWVPAITKRPSISDDLFDGAFTGVINDGGATLELSMFGLKRQDSLAATYRYAGAAVTIYQGNIGDAWPWTTVFTGLVDSFGNDAERLSLRLKVNTAPFGVPAMTATYAGTGGIEGGADLKNKVKPWCFGAASNVEPVLIDATNNVYQVSGYGPINAVTYCYEKAASFGATFGDYASYALLVAATIPPGRWATCLASGLIRLGAPAAGLITADVEGDKPSGTFIRKTGAIINRICTNAGVAGGSIDSTSLGNLDTAVPFNINLYLTEQTTVMEIVQRLARPCNAAAGVHPRTGKLYVCRTAAIGTSVLTLNAQGHKTPTDPGVLSCVEQDVSPPFWRIEMQGQRSWRVHSASEIAFTADLIEVGDYAGGTTYREGNIAVNQGARWLYINPTATAGNAPPTLPTTSNSYWSLLSYPPDYSVIGGTKPPADATRNVDRGAWSSASVAYIIGDEVQDQSSTWGALTNHTSTGGNGPPTLPATSNTDWRLRAKVGDAGLAGAAGLNNAQVLLYKRAASSPTVPSNSTTYTFATAVLATPNNGWTQAIPAVDGNPLWVTAASASNSGATDAIAAAEWASPVLVLQDGAAGSPGLNNATVYLFQRTASTTPPSVPGASTTFTFATGVLSGTLGSWAQSMPTTGGQYRWVTTATALATGTTDSITSGEWATPAILAEDGAAGPTGANTATIAMYQRGATAPTAPTGTQTLTFATGAVTGGTLNGWTTAIPAVNGQPCWVIYATFSAAATTATTTSWSTAVKFVQDGANGTATPPPVLAFIGVSATSTVSVASGATVTPSADIVGTFTGAGSWTLKIATEYDEGLGAGWQSLDGGSGGADGGSGSSGAAANASTPYTNSSGNALTVLFRATGSKTGTPSFALNQGRSFMEVS